MYLLTNGVEPAKSATPANYAGDPNLRLTITHWRYGDTAFTLGSGDTACLMLLLSEGQMVERQSRGIWSSKSAKPGLVTVTVTDPDETTTFAIRGQFNVAKLYVTVTNLADAAGLNRRPRVKTRFLERESKLERCAQRALVALHDGTGADPLFLSSTVLELSTSVLDQPFPTSERAVGGLSRRQIRRVEELIESRLSAPVASSPP